MSQINFQKGDRLTHGKFPEWGTGVVERAEGATHDGQPVQRLTIRFDSAGLKTLSTAFAPLVPAGEAAAKDAASVYARLVTVPEAANDPFKSMAARLEGVLNLYRFDKSAEGLTAWATAQTGVGDPLGVFSRGELEGAFDRFSINLDRALHDLLTKARRDAPGDVQTALRHAPQRGRDAANRLRR